VAHAKTVVLKAARMYDGKSEALASPGLVVVSDGVIAPGGKIPDGAQVIDLGDATLMPGLIDAHTHMTGEMTDDWKQHELDGLKKPIPQLTIEATAHARRTLMAGVTTVRDLGSHDLIDVGLRNAIKEGVIPGPRMLVAVDAIGSVGGHCDPTEGYRPGVLIEQPPEARTVQTGPDALRGAVRYVAKHGADVIKVCATGGVLSQTDSVDAAQLTQAELDAIVDEAHQLGRKAAAHAHGAEGAKRAMRAGIDSIEHGTFLDDEGFALAKKKNVPIVFTPVLCLSERFKRAGAPPLIVEKERKAHARQAEAFKSAMQKGVTIAFGTDAAVCPHGSQHEQLAYMVSLGMKPLAALRSAMSVDAKLLGLGDKLGTLEPGKWADVIAVPGDPSRDISVMAKVFFVMKQGTIYKKD
jgi:imidazolonepropionase-like amidohydrolase